MRLVDIPGPKETPVLGHYRDFKNDFLSTFRRGASTYGDIVRYRVGNQHIVAVFHPDLIEQILVTDANRLRKSDLQRMARPAMGNGLLLSEGDFWKPQRRMLSPPFHRAQLESYADTMAALAEEAAMRWDDGAELDVCAEMGQLTLAVATKLLFGVDVTRRPDAAHLRQSLMGTAGALAARIEGGLPLPDWIPTPSVRRLRRAAAAVAGELRTMIAERKASGQEKRDILGLLLTARDEDGSAMTEQQVLDESVTMFFGGYETTSVTLSWSFVLLSAHPEIEERLRQEHVHVLDGRRATFADLAQLRYTARFVDETLRVFPPVWGFDRQVVEPITLGGYEIPPGTILVVIPGVTHTDPRFWERPDVFDPDRWTDDATKARPKFAYFPFGGGPRICIGKQFSLMETTLVLATLLPRLYLERSGDAPVQPFAGWFLRPSAPVRMRVRRRTSGVAACGGSPL